MAYAFNPLTSLIIPAHNESSVISRCLRRICADARPDEFEIIVIANGCSDQTADTARSFDGVQVIELEEASKIAALNAGDAAATSWPRIYLDADIEISVDSLRALCDTLLSGEYLAASPRFVLEDDDANWLVRSHNRIWRHLPQLQDSLAGRGAYGVSEQGHQRFDEFPDLTADDEFINTSFAAHEKIVIDTARSHVRSARTPSALFQRRTRAFSGVQELSRESENDKPTNATGWLDVVRERPQLIKDLPAYLGLTIAAKINARLRHRRGQSEWLRDESTR